MDFFLCSDPEIGNLTQVVTAFAAVVAAGTGAYGVVHAVRSYRSSIEFQKLQATNDRRDQARYVHATFSGGHSQSNTGQFIASNAASVMPGSTFIEDQKIGSGSRVRKVLTQDVVSLGVAVNNRSDEVISDVTLTLDPGETDDDLSMAWAHTRYILPGGDWKPLLMFPRPHTDPLRLRDWKVQVTFTDGRDNTWTRKTGEPVRDFTGSH